MDKKNTIIGVALLASAIAILFLSPRIWPTPQQPVEAPPRPGTVEPASGATQGSSPSVPQSSDGASTTIGAVPEAARPAVDTSLFETLAQARPDEQIVSLSNEFIEVHFSNYGGAVAEVVLKKYPATKNSPDAYVWNRNRAVPALAFLDFAGADASTRFELVARTSDTVEWRAVIGDQLEVTRTYRLAAVVDGAEPYLIDHRTTFRNLSGQALNTPKLNLALGTAEPVDFKDPGLNLNVGLFDGEDTEFIERGAFEPGFFARNFMGDRIVKTAIPLVRPVVWASIKNQFFTAVLTPATPAVGVVARRLQMPIFEGEPAPRVAITGAVQLDPVQLAPGATEALDFTYYTGPKEYDRLVRMGKEQDLIMQFGFFGFFSKMLLYLLKFLYGFVGNWGVAIVGTTLVIRSLMWPLTASAARSAKRMAKIQGPMKEIQEKYKDNKQKQQEAMLALFREHKVNPVGGCLPLFLQIPIFFGLFSMLRSASELRFAEFLWVPDLSAPDTIGHVFGFPINIMPLLMGASMVVQMRMTPTPTVDNPTAKMMKFMPYFVTIMCYGFSSGLAVYWTASNLFSIFQQWVTNRSADPVVEKVEAKKAAAAVNTANKPVRRKKS
jgi:YidC/Oxa1 family membrane protein insertase